MLPRWIFALPESQLRMVLLHEEQHVRARDTLLLAAALALVLLTAWNPITWLTLRGLRMAVEVDCDRRVLRVAPDRRTYGESLLSVAARSRGPGLGLAAFTERSLSLETRILAMTHRATRTGGTKGAALILLGFLLTAQACGIDRPLLPETGSDAGAANDAVPEPSPPIQRVPNAPEPGSEPSPTYEDVADEPSFTPFTVAPSILNREEVVRTMAASYPPLLREAGVGGTVRVYFLIDETGVVRDRRIDQSSGHAALDQAALNVAGV
ncbi:MAG: TonB family protein, partial [Myxococcales bacterium]|nr:TonB family protein [Myxococcales bacterium]